MENVMELLRSMSDDKSNSIYLREIALLIEENDELRVKIGKEKKDGANRVENEKMKLTIKRLKSKLKDSEDYIDEIIRKRRERKVK
tara:strand:+ start:179 stop:436 length:258 start_codon:yes stop_codon:yes gene_type:complete